MAESATMAAAREEYRRKYGKEMPGDEATPEPAAKKPSYLSTVKRWVTRAHDALKIEPPRAEAATKLGADMGYLRNLNTALSTPGGNEAGEAAAFGKRFPDEITDETIKAQRQRDIEAARRRAQGVQ